MKAPAGDQRCYSLCIRAKLARGIILSNFAVLNAHAQWSTQYHPSRAELLTARYSVRGGGTIFSGCFQQRINTQWAVVHTHARTQAMTSLRQSLFLSGRSRRSAEVVTAQTPQSSRDTSTVRGITPHQSSFVSNFNVIAACSLLSFVSGAQLRDNDNLARFLVFKPISFLPNKS